MTPLLKNAITQLGFIYHKIFFEFQDTEVILWDVVSETGIARFSGHKGDVTSVLFINGKNCVISSSKDTFVKFWDIETKHCFKTLGGHQAEVLLLFIYTFTIIILRFFYLLK